MIQVIDDAPSPVDALALTAIYQTLRIHSRNIAAVFGDDIPNLESQKLIFEEKNAEATKKIRELNTEIATKDAIFERLVDVEQKYTAMTSKRHDEEISLLKKEYQEAMHKMNAEVERLQTAKADYEAIIAEKDEERMQCQNALSEVLQEQDKHVADLLLKHELEMEDTVAVVAELVTKQDQLNGEIKGAAELEMNYMQQAQEQHATLNTYHLREAEYAARLGSLLTENEKLRMTFMQQAQKRHRTLNAYSHRHIEHASRLESLVTVNEWLTQAHEEEERLHHDMSQTNSSLSRAIQQRNDEICHLKTRISQQDTMRVPDVENLKEQLRVAETQAQQYRDIMLEVQQAIFAKEEQIKRELEERDVRERGLTKHLADCDEMLDQVHRVVLAKQEQIKKEFKERDAREQRLARQLAIQRPWRRL
jgi:HAMP domain-containing protein